MPKNIYFVLLLFNSLTTKLLSSSCGMHASLMVRSHHFNQFITRIGGDCFSVNKRFVIPPAPPPPPLLSVPKKKKVPLQLLPAIHLPIIPTPPPLPALQRKKTKELPNEIKMTLPSYKDQVKGDVSFFTLQFFFQMLAKYIFLDAEATGLGNGHKLTEIGCVEVKNFKITGKKFQMLINPERHVSSSAHKLTGYTLNFLSQYPVFKSIAPNFINFIKGGAVLVMHNSHYDLKLIGEGLKDAENPYGKLEDKHVIIDSLPFARALHPNKKNDLTSLCNRYNIYTGGREKHGALIDAELLAEVFCKMLKQNNSMLPSYINWAHLCSIDFYKKFEAIQGTEGEIFFREMGIKSALPSSFRFIDDMYHPQLTENYPAVLVAFSNPQGNIIGILARHLIANTELLRLEKNIKIETPKKRHFYGSAENATVNIYSENCSTVFIGNITNTLIVKDVLEKHKKEICDMLNINEGFSIKACLDTLYFPSIEFDKNTQKIIIILNNNGRNDAAVTDVLANFIERFCNKQFFGFFNALTNEADLTNFMVKYNSQNWTVVRDFHIDNKRQLNLEREPNQKLTIIYNQHDNSVIVDSTPIADPNTIILFATPKITIKVIVLKTESEEKMPVSQIAREHPEKIVNRVCQAFQLNTLKDIIFLEKIELACKIYGEALDITPNTAVKKYFTKRGITGILPSSFKTLESVYHPWIDGEFPVLLVPLLNDKNIMVGIHRIFCNHDGSILKRKHATKDGGEKIPTKVSLGKTVGAAAEIYKTSIIPNKLIKAGESSGVIIMSEGVENALIAKEVLENIAITNSLFAKQVYAKLNIMDVFSIKSCVGVNGLIDVPLDPGTHTVVILADNDGFNEEVKQTIRKTVTFFLNSNLIVKMVLPQGKEGEKLDLNDVYLQAIGDKYRNIVQLFYDATQIRKIEELGDDKEPLQKSLQRIRGILKAPTQHISSAETPTDNKFLHKNRQSDINKAFFDLTSTYGWNKLNLK